MVSQGREFFQFGWVYIYRVTHDEYSPDLFWFDAQVRCNTIKKAPVNGAFLVES